MDGTRRTITTKMTGTKQTPSVATVCEHHLSWSGGGIMSKCRTSNVRSEGRFSHDRLAIGFGFQGHDGEVEWHTDGKPVLSKKASTSQVCRDLIVLPAGCEFHGAAQGRGECLWIYVSNDLVESKGIGRSIASCPVVDSDWSKDRLLWLLISELRDDCRQDFPRGAIFVETATLTFVSQLETYLHKKQHRLPALGALCQNKVRLIFDFVDDNIDRNLSLSELSALIDLTPAHFCRAFKEATGRSPYQYVIERRIEKAKTLLSDTHMSLADIALSTGFSHQSHLCHLFRRIVGATPGRYRKEHAMTFPGTHPRQFDAHASPFTRILPCA